LVIDDEAPIRLLCRVNLEAEGMDVIEAADGPSGVEKARDEGPDVILLDVMMPGLDGWRVAVQLLEDERTTGIPIIFLTARAEFPGAGGRRGGPGWQASGRRPTEGSCRSPRRGPRRRGVRGRRRQPRVRPGSRGRSTGVASCPRSGRERPGRGGNRPAVGR